MLGVGPRVRERPAVPRSERAVHEAIEDLLHRQLHRLGLLPDHLREYETLFLGFRGERERVEDRRLQARARDGIESHDLSPSYVVPRVRELMTDFVDTGFQAPLDDSRARVVARHFQAAGLRGHEVAFERRRILS